MKPLRCPAGHELIPGALWTPADAEAWHLEHAGCVAPAAEPPPDLVALAAAAGIAAQAWGPRSVRVADEATARELVRALRGRVVRTGEVVAWRACRSVDTERVIRGSMTPNSSEPRSATNADGARPTVGGSTR